VITDEFECYGYRRVGAELRHRGLVVNAMIAEVPRPSPLRSTMRARQTCFCGLLGSATIARNRSPSPEDTVKEMPLRMRQTRTPQHKAESQFGLL